MSRGLPLRRHPHADRPLRRCAGEGPHRRSRRRPAERCCARNPGSSRGHRRGLSRLRQPGRRRQPQCRPHGAPPRRAAGQRARRHPEPALRLRPRCRRRAARAPSAPAKSTSPLPAASNRCPARRSSWAKAEPPSSARPKIHDTTIGWRFINPLMKALYGVDSMPETGENVAEEFQVERADQDAFASLAAARRRAQETGVFGEQIVPVDVPTARAHRLVAETSILAPRPRSRALPS